MEHKCNVCNKIYKSYQSLWNHNHKFHNIKKVELSTCGIQSCLQSVYNQAKPINQPPEIKNNVCKFCSIELSNRQSRWRHEQSCSTKKTNEEIFQLYKNEIEQLKSKVDKLEKQKPSKIINNYNGAVNNGSINNNSNNLNNSNNSNRTLNICNPGKENINLLNDNETKDIMSQGMNSIISLIEHLNFNERLPQYHSFYTSAINDKYVNTIDTKTNNIIKQSKKDLFDQILNSHINKLESLGNNSKKFSEVLNKLKAFIYLKKGKKEYLNQINMLSYNKRYLIINTWDKLISDPNLTPEDIPYEFENKVKQITQMSEEECIIESSEEINSDSEDDEDYNDSDNKNNLLTHKWTPAKKQNKIKEFDV